MNAVYHLSHSGVICNLGMKKAKFHYEAAAMAGHEDARNTILESLRLSLETRSELLMHLNKVFLVENQSTQ
jgi:hypothetical protein